MGHLQGVQRLSHTLDMLQARHASSHTAEAAAPSSSSPAQQNSQDSPFPADQTSQVQGQQTPAAQSHTQQTTETQSQAQSPFEQHLEHQSPAWSPGLQSMTSTSSIPDASPSDDLRFRAAAADSWDQWAEAANRSSSPPYYTRGSSDWDLQQDQLDQRDQRGSSQDQTARPASDQLSDDQHGSAAGSAMAEAEEGQHEEPNPRAASAAAEGEQGQQQEPKPRAASAMAEAQHRLDQLVGLVASHAELQQTLARDCDLGYAWGLMGGLVPYLQQQVSLDFAICLLLLLPVLLLDMNNHLAHTVLDA